MSLVRSIYSLWKKGEIVHELARQEAEKKSENDRLKRQLEYVQSPQFIEKQAREKLNLQKEGEQVVVLPKSIQEQAFSSSEPISLTERADSSWKQWWKLVF